jgi:hypothetical protein
MKLRRLKARGFLERIVKRLNCSSALAVSLCEAKRRGRFFLRFARNFAGRECIKLFSISINIIHFRLFLLLCFRLRTQKPAGSINISFNPAPITHHAIFPRLLFALPQREILHSPYITQAGVDSCHLCDS